MRWQGAWPPASLTVVDDLPNRPRIQRSLAVVRRGPGELQIGTDPRHAVVVEELSEAFVDVLLTLDGRQTVTELGETVQSRGEDPAELVELLTRLAEAGLLEGPERVASVTVHGEGELADVIRSLAPAHGPPHVTIVTDFPDPVVVAELMADRMPHLAVRAREGVGVVGPLVLPGRTSCLRCADLHHTDRDACWPMIAAQLTARPAPADRVLATATGAFAVTQALLIADFVRLGGARPPTWNASFELDPLSGSISQRSRHPHPDCSCAAHNMVW